MLGREKSLKILGFGEFTDFEETFSRLDRENILHVLPP